MTTRALLTVLLIATSAWSKPPKKASCASGDLAACFEEGLAANSAGKDALAVKLLEKSCSGGFFRACGPLGTMHAEGRGVPLNLEKAYELYASACKANSPAACVYQGRALFNGHGVERDLELGLKQLKTGCELGVGEGCYLVGTIYDYGESGVPVDLTAAADWYQKAIDRKSPNGAFGLGSMFLEGRGVEINYELALELLSGACKSGETRSCNNLASMHLKGLGTKKDPAKAIALFERTCAAKEAVGCQNFALMLNAGLGRKADKVAARKHFRFACEKGQQLSCEELKK